MRLIHDWRKVLRHAWSLRFLAVAAVLSGIEVALPLLEGSLGLPPRTFAVLSGLAVGAAFATRLIAQKTISGDQNGK